MVGTGGSITNCCDRSSTCSAVAVRQEGDGDTLTLGGQLARKNNPPPGSTVVWRGLTQLSHIVLGLCMARENLWVIERLA